VGARDSTAGAATQTVTVTASTNTLAAPPIVASFQVFATSVSVTLGANTNPVGTVISVSTGTGGHFDVANSSIGIVAGANTTLSITGLSLNTVYGIQAGARDSTAGATTQSVVVTLSTRTLVAAPTPTSFRIFTPSISVTLGRNGNSFNTVLMISTGTSGHFNVSNSSAMLVEGNQTTLLISNLSTATAYSFQAGALDSTISNATQSITITGSTSTLAAIPTVTSFRVFTTSISVTLGANGNPSGTVIAISTGTSGHFDVSNSSVGIVSGANQTLVISNLSTNTAYGFQAGARDGSAGASTQGTTVASSTSTLSAAPGAISFSDVGSSSITMSWVTNSNPLTPPTSYQVQVSTSSDFVVASTSITFATQASTTSLSASTTYYFRVASYGRSGDISNYNTTSSTVSAASTDLLSTAPTAFRVTSIGVSSMTLAWLDNSNNESGFNVVNSTNGLYGSVGPNVTSLALTGLSPNTLIQARVAAFTALGSSTHSVTITSYTLVFAPSTPTVVSTNRSQVVVNWSTNTNPAGVVYEISRSTDNFAFAAGISTPVPFSSNLTNATATVGGLTAGGTYYFRVRAQNGDGIVTSFAVSLSTTLPQNDVIQSTGGVVDAGGTTVVIDAGVTITNSTLSDGTTQQTLVSSQTATASYNNGLQLQLAGGVQATVVASSDSLQVTSTQTIPVSVGDMTVEATSGTVTVRATADSLIVTITTGSAQNIQVTIPTASTRAVSVSLSLASGEVKANIPIGAFADLIRIRVRVPSSFPAITSAIRAAKGFGPLPDDAQAALAIGAPSVLSGFGIGLEIVTDRDLKPLKPIPITVTYRDADI
ncbi:MAG: fibronectin type III domain-containing protein, partial [Elusimicrobia bacterium]|nr:fibronectin type III domain-containing protein [Elusimicrobiota bacterium]